MSGTNEIQLRCPNCRRTLSVERLPIDNPEAVECQVLCPSCGTGGWDTDIHYFDANGNELNGDPEAWREYCRG